MKILLILLLFTDFQVNAISEHTEKTFPADHKSIRYSGRIDFSNTKEPVLIGSAAFVELLFSGNSCEVLLKNLSPDGSHGYVSLELDGEYLGRLRLDGDSMKSFAIDAKSQASTHNLKIYKATEAQNGNIAFGGVNAQKLHKLPNEPSRTIEFIGNSITCGMGIDWEEIPCDSGAWYDQHNAYWAYGPRVSRALDSRFLLSSVSGIGMYRNWNGVGPIMPEVYDDLYLNKDGKKEWSDPAFNPDLVSICLGTNDFSDGDGVNERLPFDSAEFVTSYIQFVSKLYKRYPRTQVCLLTSPMVSGEKGKTFLGCLEAVKQHFSATMPEIKKISIFNFESLVPHGCGYHPDKKDHEEMAELLIPFYKEVMGWK